MDNLITYSNDEIQEFFTGRLNFNIMQSEQLDKVLGYLASMMKVEKQVLQKSLVVNGLCPYDDA